MKVIASTGREDIAVVYIVDLGNENLVECVESVQPPLPREQKWVLLVSTMFGCPVGCMMCDAGGYFHARLTSEEILAQIDFLVDKRFPGRKVPCSQFKIQFARMGEPALNASVLDVLKALPQRYQAPGLMPSLSTIAPRGSERFLERLLEIKKQYYSGGRFQLQFSIHTTDLCLRDQIIPVRKWSFAEIAAYGERFFAHGDRKVTLNFALVQGAPVDSDVLLRYFPTDRFLIKITPLNPTYRATENRLSSHIDPIRASCDGNVADTLRQAGYEVIISIGDLEESQIGSNCGQYVRRHLEAREVLDGGYTYSIEKYPSI